MRWAIVLVCMTGCRSLLGFDDAVTIDGSSSPNDDAGDDGPNDTAGVFFCYGSAPPFRICLDAEPTTSLTLASDTTFDTNNACTLLVTQFGGPDLCVLVGIDITIEKQMSVVGGRPLVLLASHAITIQPGAAVDVSSRRNARLGAGANTGTCNANAGGADSTGAGGGGGGSLGTVGGNGADGSGNGTGGSAGSLVAAPPIVSGGCPGSAGGLAGANAGAGGNGGGAVYLLAGQQITIAGTVDASGAGGGGSGQKGGGGGGGSGGTILLDAPSINVTGIVFANGGGGGQGGGASSNGNGGDDATQPTISAKGGNAGGGGGRGGDGAITVGTGGPGVSGSNGGGGGGGGGVGRIRVLSGQSLSGTVSPPPS